MNSNAPGKTRLKVQVWLRSKDGKYLLLKTIPERRAFWQPVTGSVEAGEAIEDAALRELREETAYRAQANELTNLEYSFEFKTQAKQIVIEHAFGVQSSRSSSEIQVQIDPKEHTEFEWVSYETALKKVKFESNRVALKKVKGEIESS